MIVARHSSGAATVDGDVLRVTSEPGDETTAPLKNSALVVQPIISRGSRLEILLHELGRGQETQGANAVIGGDDNDGLVARKTGPHEGSRIVDLSAGNLDALTATDQGTAMEEDQDGDTGTRIRRAGREQAARDSDVQIETVKFG